MQLIPSCHSFVSKSLQFSESKPFPKSIRTDSVRLLEPTEADREATSKSSQAVTGENSSPACTSPQGLHSSFSRKAKNAQPGSWEGLSGTIRLLLQTSSEVISWLIWALLGSDTVFPAPSSQYHWIFTLLGAEILMYSQVWLQRGIPTLEVDSWASTSSLDTRWRLQSHEKGASSLAEPLAIAVPPSLTAQTRAEL